MKISKYLVFSLLTLTSLFCDAPNVSKNSEQVPNTNKIYPIIEGKIGYFFFLDSAMANVYDRGGIDIMLAGSFPVWKCVNIYGSVEFFNRNSTDNESMGSKWVFGVPLSLGIKSVYEFLPNAFTYLTVGPRYSFIQTRTDSLYVPRQANSGGIGLFVSGGFNFFISNHCLIDLFGEYSYIPVHFKTTTNNVYGRDVDAGGLTFGGGIGYEF